MNTIEKRIYWDSSVWVEWSRNQFGMRDLCSELLQMAEEGKLEIVISPLVIMEFAPQDDYIEALMQKYLKRSSFVRVAFSWPLANKARELVRSHSGLQGVDAGHLACAIHAKAAFFHTLDGRENKGLLGMADQFDEIRITRPQWPGQARFMFGT